MDEETGEFYGCPWGCYALFSFKKLKADFSTPVPQIINEKVLKIDFRRFNYRGYTLEDVHYDDLAIELTNMIKGGENETVEVMEYMFVMDHLICILEGLKLTNYRRKGLISKTSVSLKESVLLESFSF